MGSLAPALKVIQFAARDAGLSPLAVLAAQLVVVGVKTVLILLGHRHRLFAVWDLIAVEVPDDREARAVSGGASTTSAAAPHPEPRPEQRYFGGNSAQLRASIRA